MDGQAGRQANLAGFRADRAISISWLENWDMLSYINHCIRLEDGNGYEEEIASQWLRKNFRQGGIDSNISAYTSLIFRDVVLSVP